MKEEKDPRSFRTGSGAWTEEEDAKLLGMVEILKGKHERLGYNARQRLYGTFPNRDPKNVYSRFNTLKRIAKSGGVVKRYTYKLWTDDDVAKLRELYSHDKFHTGLASAFPDRHWRNIQAKAQELGLSRKRLKLIPFKLSSEEAAFAAGMINGDGYVVAETQRKNPRNQLASNVGFVNCEKVMIDWFVHHVPRGNVTAEDPSNKNNRKQRIYRWCLYDKPTVCLFLEQIHPYLLGKKKKKAEIILKRLAPVIANDIAESFLKAS